MNDSKTEIEFQNLVNKFRNIMSELRLNTTVQKEYILRILFETDEHLSAEEILLHLKEKYNIKVGIATVYRVLNLLEEIGLANTLDIDNFDSKLYEIGISKHHDHMVCTKCDKIIEFYDEEVEAIQEQIAINKNFKIKSHEMIIYGICEECQKGVENDK